MKIFQVFRVIAHSARVEKQQSHDFCDGRTGSCVAIPKENVAISLNFIKKTIKIHEIIAKLLRKMRVSLNF